MSWKGPSKARKRRRIITTIIMTGNSSWIQARMMVVGGQQYMRTDQGEDEIRDEGISSEPGIIGLRCE